MKHARTAAVLVAGALTSGAQRASAYDMDCAIMLCIAGGFPASTVCSAAYAEMIRRVTPWPIQPPFGICTYAAVPVAHGVPGGRATLDISTPEYEWLRRTRVLWWGGISYTTREDGQLWSWSLKSCDHENTNCRYISQAFGSNTPWPALFVSLNGQTIPLPEPIGSSFFRSRAVMVEYGDYRGHLETSDWYPY